MNYKVIYQEGAKSPMQYSYTDPLDAARQFKKLVIETATWLCFEDNPTTVEIRMEEDMPTGQRITERRVTVTTSK